MHSFLSPHFDGFWCLHICATTTSRQNISTSPEHSAAVPFSADVWRIWPATLVVGLGRIYRNLEWAGELWVWMSLWMMESCSVWGPGLLLMQGWLCAWVLPKKSLPLRHCSLQEGPDSSPFFLKLLLFQGHNANKWPGHIVFQGADACWEANSSRIAWKMWKWILFNQPTFHWASALCLALSGEHKGLR